MIDKLLFQRGHIWVRIDDDYPDDYDVVIPEHYMSVVKNLNDVETIDANGSEYRLISLNGDDFEIEFTVFGSEFEYELGVASFDELVVKCTGRIVQEDNTDILDIDTYDVISVTGEKYA